MDSHSPGAARPPRTGARKRQAAIGARVAALPWAAITASLDERGFATTGPLLTASECAALTASYADTTRFRSRVVMERHGFGRGEYRYFAYSLPDLVAGLRQALYPYLAPVANRWNAALQTGQEFPATLEEYLARCHAAGQTRP